MAIWVVPAFSSSEQFCYRCLCVQLFTLSGMCLGGGSYLTPASLWGAVFTLLSEPVKYFVPAPPRLWPCGFLSAAVHLSMRWFLLAVLPFHFPNGRRSRASFHVLAAYFSLRGFYLDLSPVVLIAFLNCSHSLSFLLLLWFWCFWQWLLNCSVSNSNEVYPMVSALTKACEVLEFILCVMGGKSRHNSLLVNNQWFPYHLCNFFLIKLLTWP